MGKSYAWLDTGTFESLLYTSRFVETIKKRQGLKIACLEEITYRDKWITKDRLLEIAGSMKSSYGQYLKKVAQNLI
jgi:glucose-1-phosphate thymidylyltransferase